MTRQRGGREMRLLSSNGRLKKWILVRLVWRWGVEEDRLCKGVDVGVCEEVVSFGCAVLVMDVMMVGFVPGGFGSSRLSLRRTLARCVRCDRKGLVRMNVDFRSVADQADLFRTNVLNRKVSADIDLVVELYDEYRAVTKELNVVRTKRNENSAQMKNIKSMSDKEKRNCIAEGKVLKEKSQILEEKARDLQVRLNEEGSRLPNLTHPDVPLGPEENATVLRTVGSPRVFNFPFRSHLDIGLDCDLFDFDAASSVTGNKFYYLRNEGAQLELALINWATNIAIKNGFTFMTTPDLARESVVQGCGFQPRGVESQVTSSPFPLSTKTERNK